MRSLLLGAMPCLLFAQAPPLSYDDIIQRARTSPEQFRTEALLAERHRALASTRGFLREGPALGIAAGPRTNPIAPTTTDQTVDLDLPLFLSQGTRSRLEASLGKADPALRDAAKIEARFRLRQAYLDAWLAEEVLHLRETDLVTVQAWFKAAQVRLETGADPAFQVTLVEGERLRAQADLDEARRQRLNAWAVLRSLADVPPVPAALAAPGEASLPPSDDLQPRFEASTLRRAIQERLDLEEQALRHQEAIATSRWSLRGSYGKEGEDRIGKVGFAYRFPRPGEGQAVRRETEATIQATKRELETALLELDARFQSALARLQTATPPLPFTGFEQSLMHLPLKDIRGLRFLVVPEPKAEGAWYPAEAIGDESAQAILSSPVKGIVSAIQVPPGQHVAAGAGLFTVQSPELARLKADWLSTRAKRDRAEGELAREQRLFDAQAGSRRDLEAARSEAATARAEEEAARLALEARGQNPETAGAVLTVKAPKAGTVTAYKIQLGQGVEAGQELGSFQAASAAIARLELPLPAPEKWQTGAVTEVRKGDGQRWKARLEGTPMTLTTDTRRLSYRLRLLGGPLPIPGTPLEVHVPLAKTVVLPQSALQQVEGTWGVFVKEGEEAEFRPVRRGPELGTDVMVLDGVKPGETVVGEGAYLLKSLQIKRKSGGEDHDH